MNAHVAMLFARRAPRLPMRGLLLVLVACLLPLASAYPESEASTVDARVEAVGHDPQTPQPGQQWTGFVRLVPGHNVTEVRFQICEVGIACFGPPTPTTLDADGRTFRFDTNDYVDAVSGRPVQWGIDDGAAWNVGYRFLFVEDGNVTEVPHGLDCLAEENKHIDWNTCDATHYFVFTMPGAKAASQTTPGIGLPLLLTALAATALRRP